MNKCIYFKETFPKVSFDKAEHIIPAGIGGIKKLPKGMVSDEANELFSKLELEFMRDSVISIPRQFYGPGKRGSLSEGKMTKSQVHILSNSEHVNDLSLGYIALSKPYIIPQVKINNSKDFIFSTQPCINSYEKEYSKFIDQLKNYENKTQIIIDQKIPMETIIIGYLKDKRNDRFYIAINNETKLNLLPELISQLIETSYLKTANTDLKKSIVTSHQGMGFNMNSFFRVCAKIVFNYLAFIIGSEVVLQDIFDPIRRFVIKGGDNRFVFMTNNLTESNSLEVLNESHSHLISIFKEGNKLKAILCLYGNNFKTVIVLSNNFKDSFTKKIYICNWLEKEEGDLWDMMGTL